MRGQVCKMLFYVNFLLLGSLFIFFICVFLDKNYEQPDAEQHYSAKTRQRKVRESRNYLLEICAEVWKKAERNKNKSNQTVLSPPKKSPLQSSVSCRDCRTKLAKLLEPYSQTWKKQEQNQQIFRSRLNVMCNGSQNAFITQTNTPVGTKLAFDGDKKKTLSVNDGQFSTFVRGNPFHDKLFTSCAVVGNGGILANSNCGDSINSAEFVIRCNLPPLLNGYQKHVGTKTNLVTANPSILLKKYGSLIGRRRMFMEHLCQYGDAKLLFPAFSYAKNTGVCLRAFHSLKDFKSTMEPLFFNPVYLRSLEPFWRSQGLREHRLSSGLIMTSLALELCEDVHLYGFWPFSVHPQSFHNLTHHYYDNVKATTNVHAMPTEFQHLLRLHSSGVLRLHVGNCEPGETYNSMYASRRLQD